MRQGGDMQVNDGVISNGGGNAPAGNGLYNWVRMRLWSPFNVQQVAFASEATPALDITGGGQHYTRQMRPLSAQAVEYQQVTIVGITGNGADLTGQLAMLPLIDVTPQRGAV